MLDGSPQPWTAHDAIRAAVLMSQRISANSVLPARRADIELTTVDGLRLVGEVAEPLAACAGTIICVHPLPTHGGMMDSHVFRKMAWRLPALADLAVVRFNTRGTSSARGTSEGSFDAGEGEGFDLRAAVAFTQDRGLPAPWLVGWSFGTDVVLKHAPALSEDFPIAGAILLSPPARYVTEEELARWRDVYFPLIAVVPEFDEFLPPAEARQRFASVAEVIDVPEAKHLWVGENAVSTVLNLIVGRVVPDKMPLPDTWDGPMERWSDL
jgi:alpha/beta superfamily hydrolase